MTRCGGPCQEMFEHGGFGLPEGWRWVESKDPDCPRVDLKAAPGQGFTLKPAGGPRVGMCPECAGVAEAAGGN